MGVVAGEVARPVAGMSRHLLSILALPFMNTVVIPAIVLTLSAARRPAIVHVEIAGIGAALTMSIGIVLLAIGLTLVVASIALFATRGEGTLAPWDPPRKLVVAGPYRYVRNPMKAGLIFVLIAETLILLSPALGLWALTFATVNVVYIRISEEPGLSRRFGSDYLRYCTAVPAWIPRLSAWSGK